MRYLQNLTPVPNDATIALTVDWAWVVLGNPKTLGEAGASPALCRNCNSIGRSQVAHPVSHSGAFEPKVMGWLLLV